MIKIICKSDFSCKKYITYFHNMFLWIYYRILVIGFGNIVKVATVV